MPPSPYLAANIGSLANYSQGSQSPIGGSMPFGRANVGGMFSGDLAGSYQSAYDTALKQNQSLYGDIMKGYQQTLRGQQQAQAGIGQGYSQLYNQVLGGIQGIGQSQAQAINDAYAQQSGASQQDLINRGLGNSTVLSSVQRGNQLDKQKADVALANQIAQLNAGYQSQLGMAGLNYANQANMQNTALQNSQLGWMNTIQAQYPNAAQYANLYAQQGATGQANADRAQASDQFNQQMQAARTARGSAGGGGQVMRPGGQGPALGPGVWGPASGAAGGLASVTPFGLGQMGGGGGFAGYGGAAQPAAGMNAGQYLAGFDQPGGTGIGAIGAASQNYGGGIGAVGGAVGGSGGWGSDEYEGY